VPCTSVDKITARAITFEIVRSRRYPLHEMITHRWPLEQAQTALEELTRREDDQVKAVQVKHGKLETKSVCHLGC
jgi:threonine dehydrogenase-like Zn-dependent dehydrogenase